MLIAGIVLARTLSSDLTIHGMFVRHFSPNQPFDLTYRRTHVVSFIC
jgi:hypothetical protein